MRKTGFKTCNNPIFLISINCFNIKNHCIKQMLSIVDICSDCYLSVYDFL